MKDKIIIYAIFFILSIFIIPATKFVLDKKKCEKQLLEFQEQEVKVIETIKTNNQQINVIKKKLSANPNREYRKQLLSQIFVD